MHRTTEQGVAVSVVTTLLQALRRLGADPGSVCREVGIAPSALRDPTGRIPSALAAALLAVAGRRLHDPLIGLHAGAKSRPHGTLTYLLLSSPSLEWGIRQCDRFARVASDATRMHLQRRGPLAYLTIIRDAGRHDDGRQVVDFALATVARAVRAATGLPRDTIVHVHHAQHGPTSEWQRVFRCPVRFGRATNALVFPATELARRSRFADPLVAAQIEQLATSLERRLTHGSIRERVADVIRTMSIYGVRVTRALVGRQLGMSGRTLQRALAAERTTFAAVRDAVVWDGVPGMLTNPTATIDTVAACAGFATTAAFSKAFKRRTGCSPSAYRQQAVL